ncbi:MAG: ABC transporter permease, partial [Spirochaetes bacterium]
MLVLGSYLTPKLMGGKNALWFTEQIYNSIIIYFNWNQGAAFGFLLLLLSSLIILLALKLTRQEFSKVIK